LYVELEQAGYGKSGTQALQLTLAKASGIEWPA